MSSSPGRQHSAVSVSGAMRRGKLQSCDKLFPTPKSSSFSSSSSSSKGLSNRGRERGRGGEREQPASESTHECHLVLNSQNSFPQAGRFRSTNAMPCFVGNRPED